MKGDMPHAWLLVAGPLSDRGYDLPPPADTVGACVKLMSGNYSVFPVIPSQCRNTGVGIRFSFAQVSQFEYAKEMRIATPVTSVTGSQ